MKFWQNLSSGFLFIILISVFVQCSNGETIETFEVTTTSTVVVTITEDTEAPIFTTDPQVTELTESSVNLSWIVEDNYGAPEIKIYINDVEKYTGKDSQYQITDLEPDTDYVLVIIASDLNNNISTKTLEISTKPIVDVEPPRFVKSLTLDSVTYESATISWEVEDTVSNFEITLFINNEEINNVSSPYILQDLAGNTKYTLRLVAVDTSNNESTNQLSFQTPQDPSITQTSLNFVTPLQITSITSNSASAFWDVENVTGNVTFTLFAGDLIIYSGQDNQFKLTNLEPNTYYELDLSAQDESKTEIFSFISFTTSQYIDDVIPEFVNQLTASNVSSSSVNLIWKAEDNVGIDYYILKQGNNQIYKGLQTERQIDGLTANANYSFTVEAFDNEGNSSVSKYFCSNSFCSNYHYNIS